MIFINWGIWSASRPPWNMGQVQQVSNFGYRKPMFSRFKGSPTENDQMKGWLWWLCSYVSTSRTAMLSQPYIPSHTRHLGDSQQRVTWRQTLSQTASTARCKWWLWSCHGTGSNFLNRGAKFSRSQEVSKVRIPHGVLAYRQSHLAKYQSWKSEVSTIVSSSTCKIESKDGVDPNQSKSVIRETPQFPFWAQIKCQVRFHTKSLQKVRQNCHLTRVHDVLLLQWHHLHLCTSIYNNLYPFTSIYIHISQQSTI